MPEIETSFKTYEVKATHVHVYISIKNNVTNFQHYLLFLPVECQRSTD